MVQLRPAEVDSLMVDLRAIKQDERYQRARNFVRWHCECLFEDPATPQVLYVDVTAKDRRELASHGYKLRNQRDFFK